MKTPDEIETLVGLFRAYQLSHIDFDSSMHMYLTGLVQRGFDSDKSRDNPFKYIIPLGELTDKLTKLCNQELSEITPEGTGKIWLEGYRTFKHTGETYTMDPLKEGVMPESAEELSDCFGLAGIYAENLRFNSEAKAFRRLQLDLPGYASLINSFLIEFNSDSFKVTEKDFAELGQMLSTGNLCKKTSISLYDTRPVNQKAI